MKSPSQSPRKSNKVLIILAVTALLLVSVGAAAYWWHNRPITPTVLDAQEQKVLDQKIEVVQKPSYQPGDKTISLTEREVNALFHHNTGLGYKVKFELAHHAIHARIRTELDPDLPLVGGKTLKAKARFNAVPIGVSMGHHLQLAPREANATAKRTARLVTA